VRKSGAVLGVAVALLVLSEKSGEGGVLVLES
jgi:hypothetical protein